MSWVLIMVLTVYAEPGVTVSTLQQEFSSFATCEAARSELVKMHNAKALRYVISQGCYKK